MSKTELDLRNAAHSYAKDPCSDDAWHELRRAAVFHALDSADYHGVASGQTMPALSDEERAALLRVGAELLVRSESWARLARRVIDRIAATHDAGKGE